MMGYQPQLATLVKEAPVGDDWFHEVKYDGYRIGALLQRGRALATSSDRIASSSISIPAPRCRGRRWSQRRARCDALSRRSISSPG
jgi:hypothetical protein